MARRQSGPAVNVPRFNNNNNQGDKFCDPIFPPDVYSLCFDPENPKLDPDVRQFVSQVKMWRRPSEWCKNPVLFKDDASPGDIEQGQLGDCWLLSALGVVAVKSAILKHLFVKVDGVRGEYRLRFYLEGKWEEVTIDDRFPCGADGKPIFGHCKDSEEIWVLVIEKALAKLLGTYEALDGGYLEEGVVMLTGGRPEKVTINDWKGKSCFEETAADLWHKLLTYHEEGHMMGVAICSGKEMPDKSTGLVAGHAYGVLDVYPTKDGKYKLIQLRNPWGSFEWKGKWSDGSREWTPNYSKEVGYQSADDGTFWMELTDFRKYFDKITVCRIFNLRIFSLPSPIVTPEDKEIFGNTEWHRVKYECEWNESNAGGLTNNFSYSQNPHFSLTVREKSRVFFLVSQPSLSTQAESRYYRTAIGFSVQKGTVASKGSIKLPNGASTPDIFVQVPQRNRYNAAHLVVEPGQYLIVPFTNYPNRKSKFVLEIYGEKKFESSVLLPEDAAACKGVPPSARGVRDPVAALSDSLQKSVRINSQPSSARRVESSPQMPAAPRGMADTRREAPQRSSPPPYAQTQTRERETRDRETRESVPLRDRLQQHQKSYQERRQNVTTLPQEPPAGFQKTTKYQTGNFSPEMSKAHASTMNKNLFQTTNMIHYGK